MPPKGWKPCPYCGQPFSSSSMAMHMKRCSQSADVKAEAELRELENWSRPTPLPDWPQCPNCGEQYGPTAIGPHTARCRRLRPHGANGFGPGGSPKIAPGAEPFKGLWGIGDISDLIRQLRERAGLSKDAPMNKVRDLFKKWDADDNGKITRAEMTRVLQDLTDFTKEQIDALFDAADTDKDGCIDYEEFLDFLWNPRDKKLSAAELEALRALFNRFDEDKDGSLEHAEFVSLMQNMLPTRVGDFDVADIDSDGGISFEEFVKYWQSVVGKPGFNAGELDEVADMFDCFDKNDSMELERDEFLSLLDNLFPGHCEENRKYVDAEFAGCDVGKTNGISFAELLAYYDRLKEWYGEKNGWPPLDPEEREESLGAEFVTSRCGLCFLPDRLPIHHRSCPTCKKIIEDEQASRLEKLKNQSAKLEALRKAQEEEDARRRREEEEEEERRRREQEEEDRRIREEDLRRREEELERRKAAQEEEDEKRRREQEEEDERRRREQERKEARARRMALEEEEERRRRAEEEEEARRRAAEAEAQRRANQPEDPNGFVPCRYCGRTFFPDRLPKHERICPKAKGSIHGIRPTMTPGESIATIGRYDIPR